jgi:hypothetical protein
MKLEEVKLFLEMGDSLKLRLGDPLKITFIFWPEDYDPANPEPFEHRFKCLTTGIADYTIVRDDGTGLELLRAAHEEKQIK